MTVELQEETNSAFVFVIYGCSIGGFVGLIVTILILINISTMYQTMPKEQKNKTSFKLIFMYFPFAVITCIANGFISTNVFTGNNIEQWSSLRCGFGWFLSNIGSSIAGGLLYIIFVYRIYAIFKNSAYEYKPCIINTYYVIIVIVFFVLWIPRLIQFSQQSVWTLYHNKSMNLSYCTNNTGSKSQGLLFYTAIIVLFHLFMSVSLCYMFGKGLYALNKSLIQQFVEQHSVSPEEEETAETNTEHNKDASVGVVLENFQSKQHNTVRRKVMKRDVNRILNLHNLIKRQTILVFIAISSSIALWILAAINKLFLLLICWDVMINVICAWLMLSNSDRYWKFCTKYGPCYCCYYKENTTDMRLSHKQQPSKSNT